MRIQISNREKELIQNYGYTAPKNIKDQLTNKQRKTLDIEPDEIEDLVGFLSLECNHCENKQLSYELNDLCEMLESFC